MMAHIEQFPEVFLAVQQELYNHPDLCERMKEECDLNADFPERLGTLAAMLEIVVDGYYTYEAIEKLCDILVRKMMERRTSVLLPFLSSAGEVVIAQEDALPLLDKIGAADGTDKTRH